MTPLMSTTAAPLVPRIFPMIEDEGQNVVQFTLRVPQSLLDDVRAVGAARGNKSQTKSMIEAAEQYVLRAKTGAPIDEPAPNGYVSIPVPIGAAETVRQLARAFPNSTDWMLIRSILVEVLKQTNERIQQATVDLEATHGRS